MLFYKNTVFRENNMQSLPEHLVKEQRIREMLAQLGYHSLLLTRRENFAWLSCGHKAVVSYVSETSPVFLLITPSKKYAIGQNMDLPRTFEEELDGQGYEPVSLPTFGKSPLEKAVELAEGRLAADDCLAGIDNIAADILKIHEPFTPEEMERYDQVCKESAAIVKDLALWVKPGVTERQMLAKMWGMYLEQGFEGDCMFIVSDDRIKHYRHGVSSDKPIEKHLLIAPAVYKAGLHVQFTRTIHFGEPPADIRKRHDAVSAIHAAVLNMTYPGVRLASMRQKVFDLFDRFGYPEEKTNHMHGGPTGYHNSYPGRCDDPQAVAVANMVFTWYITVKGAKSEETVLLGENGINIASDNHDWPMMDLDVDGSMIRLPDIMVK